MAQRGAGDGRLAWLAVIVHAHQAGVWRYAHFLSGDPSLADDITQETFLAVLRQPFDDRSFPQTQTYLRTIARRLLVSLPRSPATRTDMLSLDALETMDAVWAETSDDDGGDARLDALKHCLDQLDERERRALNLQYREEASRADIGAALDLSDGGVKNLLQRVKESLRRCVEGRIAS